MIIMAGDLEIRPGSLDTLKPHMEAMLNASRLEQGCIAYSYAVDLLEPMVVRVHEKWQSWQDLERHLASEHLQHWRETLQTVGIVSRQMMAWEVADTDGRII